MLKVLLAINKISPIFFYQSNKNFIVTEDFEFLMNKCNAKIYDALQINYFDIFSVYLIIKNLSRYSSLS